MYDNPRATAAFGRNTIRPYRFAVAYGAKDRNSYALLRMIQNARIVCVGADVREYLKQPKMPLPFDRAPVRSEPDYEMTRSGLIQFAECPSKWRDTEDSDKDELGTKATDWGTLIDCLITDAVRFEDRIAIYPENYPCEPTSRDPRTEKPWTNRADYCAKWKEKQEADGKKCFTVETVNEARLAAREFRDDPRIARVLDCAQFQVWVRGEWLDRATGLSIPLKTLIDIVPTIDFRLTTPVTDADAAGWIAESLADLKTARNASPAAWEAVCYENGYHVQGALALMLYNAVPGVTKRSFFLHVISENEPPYQTGRRLLGAEMISQATIFLKSTLSRYAHCLKTNEWPDYECTPKSRDGWTVVEPKPHREQQLMESLPVIQEPEPEPKHPENLDLIP